MNKATICEPANEILEEIGVPCKQIKECEGMYMVDPPARHRRTDCRGLQRPAQRS